MSTAANNCGHQRHYILLSSYNGKVLPEMIMNNAFDFQIVIGGLAQKVVLVTNEEQHILWEEYGLRLHIPSNSLPDDCSQFELKIDVGLPAQFELSTSYDTIVSAVYSFSHDLGDKQLRQPVTLEMQHCATSAFLNDLSVIKANQHSNEFKIIPGGDFITTKGYGVIKLHYFSRFSTFMRRLSSIFTSVQYSAMSYYTNIIHLQFDFEFCIIRDIRALSKVCSATCNITYRYF